MADVAGASAEYDMAPTFSPDNAPLVRDRQGPTKTLTSPRVHVYVEACTATDSPHNTKAAHSLICFMSIPPKD
jgi:hypothetical protein